MFLKSFFKKKGHFFLWLLVLCLIIPLMSGCGSDSDNASLSQINGNASKGPVYPGTVTAYSVVGGEKGNVLATAQTDPNGNYTIQVVGYTGPVILEVSGRYYDEATGDPNKHIDPNEPLHAMLSSTTGTITAAVTPFTEIAYQRAKVIGKGKDPADPNRIVLDPNTIDQANSEISILLWVDITRTTPANVLDPDSLDVDPNNWQKLSQIKYGLYLAALSKMADANNLDPLDMIQKLADQFNNGQVGEAGEITINDIGDAIVAVVNDPNIVDPNHADFTEILNIAQDQSDLFDQRHDPNDPNSVTLVGSPNAGEGLLEQAKAMIGELRTKALNTEDSFVDEDAMIVSEMETDVLPELESFGDMVWVLQEGILDIMDPNEFDPNSLLDPDNMPFQDSATVMLAPYTYTVTLTLDIRTGYLLRDLLDPNRQDELQDPNYWDTFADPNFIDKFLDPNEQAELQDPNLFAGLDPNILAEQGFDPNILAQFEDPNIDIFYFQAGYSIQLGVINRGTGAMTLSLDRNNGRIDLFKVNGSLGDASLTDFGISLWKDETDPNQTGVTLRFGKFQTSNIMMDANFSMTFLGGPFAKEKIGEADSIGLSLFSMKGAFEVTNTFRWFGEIRFSDPVLVDPNFEYPNLYLPSKITMIGEYEVPGAHSFEGTISGKLLNMQEMYAYDMLDIGDPNDPPDPNIQIDVLGTVTTENEPEMQLSMTMSHTQDDIYDISSLQFQVPSEGVLITGSASFDDTFGAEKIILNLQNQDGLQVHFVMDFSQPPGSELSGWIKKDGALLATFEFIDEVPVVKYYTGEFESLF